MASGSPGHIIPARPRFPHRRSVPRVAERFLGRQGQRDRFTLAKRLKIERACPQRRPKRLPLNWACPARGHRPAPRQRRSRHDSSPDDASTVCRSSPNAWKQALRRAQSPKHPDFQFPLFPGQAQSLFSLPMFLFDGKLRIISLDLVIGQAELHKHLPSAADDLLGIPGPADLLRPVAETRFGPGRPWPPFAGWTRRLVLFHGKLSGFTSPKADTPGCPTIRPSPEWLATCRRPACPRAARRPGS